MFFLLSKILWPLLQPAYHLVFSVFLAAGAHILKWRKTGLVFSCYAALILFVFGVMPTGYNMMVYLERQYERPILSHNYVPHGIIVMGGAFDEDLTEKYGQVMAAGALERMTTFLSLARRYDKMPTKLVFTGGSARTTQSAEDNIAVDGAFTDTDAAALFMMEQGFALGRFIFEGKSRTTYENVIFSKELLAPHRGEDWMLITSAFHMPRAMNVFEQQGWDIKPYPVDYRTHGKYKMGLSLNILKNFQFTQLAIHEAVGNAVYYLTGKAASFLP